MAAPKGNKYALGLTTNGRPPMYDDPDLFAKKCAEFFEYIQGEMDPDTKCWIREPEHPTVTGLALYLGFESRISMYEYAKKDDFTYVVKRALSIIENSYERGLYNNSVAGMIFALKNMGWKDKTEVEQSGPDGGPIQSENKHVVEFRNYSDQKPT